MIGNKIKIKLSLQTGFTLVELLVSLSIISLLTALFLANYHNTNQRTDLVMAAQTMVTNIRFAQANALGLVRYDGAVPAGGWGVFLSSYSDEKDKYIIFADIDGDQSFSSNESVANYGAKIVSLPNNITIDNLETDSGQKVEKVNVIFLPPDPITYIATEYGTTTALNIRLKESLNNTTKTIRVNFLGLVEVID